MLVNLSFSRYAKEKESRNCGGVDEMKRERERQTQTTANDIRYIISFVIIIKLTILKFDFFF